MATPPDSCRVTRAVRIRTQATRVGKGWPARSTKWVQQAARATFGMVGLPVTLPDCRSATVDISVLLTTDRAVRKANRIYRDVDRPTNVLSFVLAEPVRIGKSRMTVLLGELLLAYGVTVREARQSGMSLRAHVLHLVVHGLLHLFGYDHEQSEEEAETQEQLEIAILATLGVENPYVSGALPSGTGETAP